MDKKNKNGASGSLLAILVCVCVCHPILHQPKHIHAVLNVYGSTIHNYAVHCAQR